MKVISAICATSGSVSRQQIRYDESTGLIVEAGDLKVPESKLDFLFSEDCLLFAGMGDIHIHAREDISGKNNYKEDFASAHQAMMNGGVVHAGDMPNNPIPPVDDTSYESKFKLAAAKTQGDLWLYAGIGPGTKPLSYPVPYKVYMGPSVGELFFKDLATLDETLSHYRGQHVSFHCEDPEILDQHQKEKHHHQRRPVSAEVVATLDALKLIQKHSLVGKLCHYSSRQGIDLIREYRKKGVNVSLEVTPQHLYFDMDHLQEGDWKKYQMNPPLRYESDRVVLMSALRRGEIQYLATDHAPHTEEEKIKGTSGLTGLDTYGGFVTWLLAQGMDPKQVAKASSENPGDFFNTFLPSWKKIIPAYKNFGKGLGQLKADYAASFTVLNLKKSHLVSSESLKTKVKHSPFLGHTFPGQVEALFIRGKKV